MVLYTCALRVCFFSFFHFEHRSVPAAISVVFDNFSSSVFVFVVHNGRRKNKVVALPQQKWFEEDKEKNEARNPVAAVLGTFCTAASLTFYYGCALLCIFIAGAATFGLKAIVRQRA